MSKNVSMDAIAAELNVSKSLVSRALADKYGVSDEMRNTIRTTAIKMGYKFKNRTKRSNSKVESITMVVESHDLLDTKFWAMIIRSIEKELYRRNVSVFLSVIENDNEDFMPLSLKQMKTGGILVLGQIPLKHIVSICTTGLPVVLVDSTYSNWKFDHVMANNYYGAYEATELILNYGYRNIGFVGSTEYSFSYNERFRGFTDCIKCRDDATVITHEVIERFDSFYIPFSREQFRKAITSGNRPSALLCASDIIALQAYEILGELGIKVPGEISIVGFDNINKGEWVSPPLTTVNIPKTELGEEAVDLLFNRIENPDRNHRLIMIGTEIVVRESLIPARDLNVEKKLRK